MNLETLHKDDDDDYDTVMDRLKGKGEFGLDESVSDHGDVV
jgi:hypothetical protein